jgi:hypothetical protein
MFWLVMCIATSDTCKWAVKQETTTTAVANTLRAATSIKADILQI